MTRPNTYLGNPVEITLQSLVWTVGKQTEGQHQGLHSIEPGEQPVVQAVRYWSKALCLNLQKAFDDRIIRRKAGNKATFPERKRGGPKAAAFDAVAVISCPT